MMTTTATEVVKNQKRGNVSWKDIALTIGIPLVAVHGWFALQYGTPEPCAAAVERFIAVGGTELMEQAEHKLASNPFGGLAMAMMPGMLNSMKPIYLQTMRKKGVLTCYLAAFGTMDDELIDKLRKLEAQR
jgi:hypothetical protein